MQSAEPDLKASQVTVKGVFAAQKLVEYVYKRTGKHAVVAKEEPVDKKPAEEEKKDDGAGGDAAKEEKKADEAGGANAEGEKKEEKGGEGGGGGGGDENDKKEGGGGATEDGAAPPAKVMELMRNEFYQYYPRYAAGYVGYAYPPQIFSDENPNACSVM